MRLQDREKLSRLMKDADMTGARLARKVGCTRSFISKLVTGKSATCNAVFATRIEEALSVPTGHLFVRNDEPVRQPRLSRPAKAA